MFLSDLFARPVLLQKLKVIVPSSSLLCHSWYFHIMVYPGPRMILQRNNCLFCSHCFCCCSFPSTVYSVWFVLKYYLSVYPKHSNFGLFCYALNRVFMVPSLVIFSLTTSPLLLWERSSPHSVYNILQVTGICIFLLILIHMPLIHF